MPLIKSQIIVFVFVWLFANQIDSYAKIEIGDVNKLTQSEKIKASKLYKEYENNQDNYSNKYPSLRNDGHGSTCRSNDV